MEASCEASMEDVTADGEALCYFLILDFGVARRILTVFT